MNPHSPQAEAAGLAPPLRRADPEPRSVLERELHELRFRYALLQRIHAWTLHHQARTRRRGGHWRRPDCD